MTRNNKIILVLNSNLSLLYTFHIIFMSTVKFQNYMVYKIMKYELTEKHFSRNNDKNSYIILVLTW